MTRNFCTAQIVLLTLVLARAAAACTDVGDAGPSGVDGGADDAPSPLASRCPDTLPVDGETCRIPEGTTCELGACATQIATCTRGRWRVGSNPDPSPPCPAATPDLGDPCPPCWPAARSCRYGSTDCTLPDASQNVATASCASGAWMVRIDPCLDASADAPSDVQDDAESGRD
jgi:hypothetical protein